MTNTTASDHLSRRRKLLFSIGDLSTSIPLAILMFFQLFFLTDVAGLNPAYAAWAVGIPRIWDAINDPLFGLVSDRIRTRWGRRRVLLLFGAVPLGLTFMLMWLVPSFGQAGLALYYATVFILFDTVFTLVHVGYNALTPEMTSDYDERSSLNGYRMAFSIAGTLGAIILATVLGWYIADLQVRFAVTGVILGLLAMIPPLIVFRITRSGPPTSCRPRSRSRPPWSPREQPALPVGDGVVPAQLDDGQHPRRGADLFRQLLPAGAGAGQLLRAHRQGRGDPVHPVLGVGDAAAGQAAGVHPRRGVVDRRAAGDRVVAGGPGDAGVPAGRALGSGIATAYVLPGRWCRTSSSTISCRPASAAKAPTMPSPPSSRSWRPARRCG